MLKETQRKVILLLIVIVSVLLNLYTFVQAYPKTFMPTYHINVQQTLAKDFSAYYTAAWRLFYDPSNVYAQEPVNDGGPVPQPQAFRYLPSFLTLVSPLLSLKYQDGLIAFDIIQFLLLPIMAFLLYGLLKERSTLIIAAMIIIAILQPSPTPQWGLSASYFWQWAEGQAKVLNTALLLLALYLGKTGKPILSGGLLGVAAFDPRFFLLSLPLFAVYNIPNLKKAGLSLIATLIVFNLPLLLIDGIGPGFLKMAFQEGTSSPIFYYSLIPLMTLTSLIVVNIRELYLLLRAGLSKRASKNTTALFSANADLMRRNFPKQRKRIAAKLKNTRFIQITFHTFLHWKATIEYRKTRDILHVKEALGHKSLNSTMMYTQLISFKDDDEYTIAVAHSEEEAVKLAEAGFEFDCNYEKNKILRKRK